MYQAEEEVERLRQAASTVLEAASSLSARRQTDAENWTRQAEEMRNVLAAAQRRVSVLDRELQDAKQLVATQSRQLEEQNASIRNLQSQVNKQKSRNAALQKMFMEDQNEEMDVDHSFNGTAAFQPVFGFCQQPQLNPSFKAENKEPANCTEKRNSGGDAKSFLSAARQKLSAADSKQLFELVKAGRSSNREELLQKGWQLLQSSPHGQELMAEFTGVIDAERATVA